MEIGKIIEKERKKQHLSKYKLAKMAGVTETAIRYWESGERTMNISSADKVLKALGVTVTIGKETEDEQ